jgi:hypothetical protein
MPLRQCLKKESSDQLPNYEALPSGASFFGTRSVQQLVRSLFMFLFRIPPFGKSGFCNELLQ